MSRFPFKPAIALDLDGSGGNVFEIVGHCRSVARQIGFDQKLIDKFSASVMASDSYANALAIVRDWFEVKEPS